MIEIRRNEDQELCGGVVADDADQGLASLAAHWLLTGPGFDGEQIVCIQSASPGSVTVALDYYSFPGVPTLTLSADDLGTGPGTDESRRPRDPAGRDGSQRDRHRLRLAP